MKKITMVLISCFISFFLGLLNTGYAEDVKSEYSEDVKSNFDFSVVFPKDDVVYLNGNPSLALIWDDEKTVFDSKADFDTGAVYAVYEVSICGDNSFKEPIHSNWLSNTEIWVITTSIANEIGLESGEIYFWRVRRYSQSEGRMISTDIGSFSVGGNLSDFGGHLCGHVSTGHDFVEVTRPDGHTEELYVYAGWFAGAFSPGSYSVCAGDQCHESVQIMSLCITESNF